MAITELTLESDDLCVEVLDFALSVSRKVSLSFSISLIIFLNLDVFYSYVSTYLFLVSSASVVLSRNKKKLSAMER